MSWFRTPNAQHPSYTGLQLQTSTGTLPVAILYGRTKASSNVVWYSNFQAQAQKQGKGGALSGLFGGGGVTTGYSYSADVILALCEGPIGGIGTVWRDQSTYALADLGLTFFNGTTPQAVWNYLATTYPGQALAYQGTAYVCAASYQLGGSAGVGNHNFEVIGILAGTGVNGLDADPALVIEDFLTNPQYGVGFDPASIDATTLLGAGGDGSLQSYCRAIGIAFSPALVSQEQGSSVLSRWLQLLNCGIVWSGAKLKFIPYGDTTISAGNVARNVQFTVPTPAPVGSGPAVLPQVAVCPAAQFVADLGVTYAFTGVALTHTGSTSTGVGCYGISPSGTYIFSGLDEGKIVNVAYTYAVPAGYVPNLTPVYNLTDLDFLDDGGDKDPVQASRVDALSLPTIQRIECLSRANQYGSTPIEARDQAQLEASGARVGSTVQAHEICDEVNIGPIVAQSILQRQLYVRANFTFKLSWEYGLLDPGDIVAISDSNLGLSSYAVRITSIEEDDKGFLAIMAEELTIGVSTPQFYQSSGLAPVFQPNQAQGAGAINPPLIYEPPPPLTGNVAQVWVGASGGANSSWGGAFVWASVDNISYSKIAVVTTPLRQGVLTANLAAASGFDLTNTLSLDMSESGGALSGTSAASAQAGSTLSLIDGELLAYETATLTGANAYNLTGLERGFAGTAGASHAIGAAFARLDDSVVKYNLPSTWIGVTIYVKFQSFNAFGAGLQDLSTCTAYTYVPTGAGAIGPVTQALLIGTALDYGLVSQAVSETDDWGSASSVATTFIDLGGVA